MLLPTQFHVWGGGSRPNAPSTAERCAQGVVASVRCGFAKSCARHWFRRSFPDMARIEVKSVQPKVASVWVEIENITGGEIQRIYKTLDTLIDTEEQVSDAVAKALVFAAELAPKANPSDLWHHVIYRHLLDLGYNDARWKRISGFALERAFVNIYEPRLERHDLTLRIVKGPEATKALAQIGLDVRATKVDLFAEDTDGITSTVVGAVHVKSSLAERIQDDVPASLAFMEHGLVSIVLTMDVKSFPPPHGDGVNYGELGGRSFEIDKARQKRDYVEKHGQFDGMFSYNLRTPSSRGKTPSGKRIYTLPLMEQQPDQLVRFLIERRDAILGKQK